jgi:hypothetical protein
MEISFRIAQLITLTLFILFLAPTASAILLASFPLLMVVVWDMSKLPCSRPCLKASFEELS